MNRVEGHLTESQGQNLALHVVRVPCSFDKSYSRSRTSERSFPLPDTRGELFGPFENLGTPLRIFSAGEIAILQQVGIVHFV